MLVQAYLLLEENERTLGWHGRHDLFGTYHHGNRMGVGLRSVDFKQAKPKLDRPEVEKAIQAADSEGKFWAGRARHCRQALELMRQARPNVLPGSRAELDYVIYKTANFITVFEELGAADEATAAFDRALLAMNAGDAAGARSQLEQTQVALDRANRLVHEAARQMIPYAHIPTERHILYLFNDAMPSHQAMRRYLSEVIAFRKGMHGQRAKDHVQATSAEGTASIRIVRGIRFWTGNRRADWKVASSLVNMVRLLLLGAYPSGASMGKPGEKQRQTPI
jgi:hypothetical protein